MAIKNPAEFDEELVQLSRIPTEIAVLPINDAVVFPLMTVPLLLNDPKLLRLADEALADERVIKHRDKALGIVEYKTNNIGKIEQRTYDDG